MDISIFNGIYTGKKCLVIYRLHMYPDPDPDPELKIHIVHSLWNSMDRIFKFDRKHYLSVHFYQSCLNSVLNPICEYGSSGFISNT